MFQMFQGFWRACINAVDDERNADNLKMLGAHNPFVVSSLENLLDRYYASG